VSNFSLTKKSFGVFVSCLVCLKAETPGYLRNGVQQFIVAMQKQSFALLKSLTLQTKLEERMKKLLILLALGAIWVMVLVFSGSFVTAAVPHLINYQGMLTNNLGDPLNETPDITFEIWNAPSGGIRRWWEIQSNVPVTNGLFNVILGNVTPINLNFDQDTAYWLQIIVEEDTMPSRLKFTSVAFAYRAQKSDTAAYAISGGSYSHNHDDLYVNDDRRDSIRASSSNPLFSVRNTGSGEGIYVDAPGNDGIYIDSAGDMGVRVHDVAWAGVYVYDSEHEGIWMDAITKDGIYLQNIGDNGINIFSAGDNGLHVQLADIGVYIDSTRAGYDGIVINYGEDDGVQVTHADDDGIYVSDAGGDGMYVYHADRFGLYIYDSDSNGIHVASADHDGIEAHGARRGGTFQSSSSGWAGVGAYSYDKSSTHVGLIVEGYANASGGWRTSMAGASGDVPAFSVSSPDVELIISGTGTLVGGKAEIAFEQIFQEAISSEIPVKVVLTAQGAPSGLLYVASKSNQGFSVERLDIPDLAIKSDDITFDWIAIARQKGYEQRPEVIMEEEGAVADQISQEEEMRAEELKHQEELERDARYRQEMQEKQARKEAERLEKEKEKEEESTD
jgi:hypothetical protein